MKSSTTTWISHQVRSFQGFCRVCESLTKWENEACVTHTATPDALITAAQTDKQNHPHKLNRREPNQTINHTNITMCFPLF